MTPLEAILNREAAIANGQSPPDLPALGTIGTVDRKARDLMIDALWSLGPSPDAQALTDATTGADHMVVQAAANIVLRAQEEQANKTAVAAITSANIQYRRTVGLAK